MAGSCERAGHDYRPEPGMTYRFNGRDHEALGCHWCGSWVPGKPLTPETDTTDSEESQT